MRKRIGSEKTEYSQKLLGVTAVMITSVCYGLVPAFSFVAFAMGVWCSASSYRPEAYSYRCTSWISPFPAGFTAVISPLRRQKERAEVFAPALSVFADHHDQLKDADNENEEGEVSPSHLLKDDSDHTFAANFPPP